AAPRDRDRWRRAGTPRPSRWRRSAPAPSDWPTTARRLSSDCASRLLNSVGWVKRSATHRYVEARAGFASLYPPYELTAYIRANGAPGGVDDAGLVPLRECLPVRAAGGARPRRVGTRQPAQQ